MWQKVLNFELKRIKHVSKLTTCSDADYLIIQRVAFVQQIGEDLVDYRSVELFWLDWNPLSKESCDSSSEQIISRLLYLNFLNQGRFQETIEIELFFDARASEANRSV